jgi:hypothetical protein
MTICGNPHCTKGPDGGPTQRLVYASRLDRLTRYPWTCSIECREAVVTRGSAPPPGYVNAAELICELGTSRQFVYRHADELGAMRLSDGGRPRLLFELESAHSAFLAIAKQGTERDPSEMAEIITTELGSAVSRDALMRAAREQKITARRSAHRVYFAPERVLAEITSGKWRPHGPPTQPPQPARMTICGNPHCTKGPDGGPTQRLVYASRLDRCKPWNSWTCSDQCRSAAVKRRTRSVKRECACEGCMGVVWITKRQEISGKGPRRCDACKAADRSTPAQLAGRPLSPDSRAKFIAVFAETRERNGRSPAHMDKLVSARMAAHATHKHKRDEQVRAALIADPGASNTAIARRLSCSYYAVAWVRCDLEEAATIPLRDGKPQKRPDPKRVPPCEYTEENKKTVKGNATSRAIAASKKGADRRIARDELDDRIIVELDAKVRVVEIAARLHISERRVQFAARRRGRPAGKPGRPAKA